MPLAKTAVALLTEHAACEDAFAKRVIAGLIKLALPTRQEPALLHLEGGAAEGP